jgi:hypothetical protein
VHAEGDAVDRTAMLRRAAGAELPVEALRDAVFDPPHAGGGARRRAHPNGMMRRAALAQILPPWALTRLLLVLRR